MAASQTAIEKLLHVSSRRTVGNTLAPYDDAFDHLQEAQELAGLMLSIHPDASFRDRATAVRARIDQRLSELSVNRDVYDALSTVDLSATDPGTRYYVTRELLLFRLAGVDKDELTRKKLTKLRTQLSLAQSAFERNIADGNHTIEVTDLHQLDGLPQDYIDKHKPDAKGVVHLSTRYNDYLPVMTFASNDALRKRMSEANGEKAYPENDSVLRQMMQIRFTIARLLGFSSWSDMNAQDKMIGSGPAIASFISSLDATVRPFEQREFDLLLAEKRKSDPQAKLVVVNEYQRLSELVRRSKYDFNSESVRAYFPYDRVQPGVLNTASRLFGLQFHQEAEAQAWDLSVQTWDVLEGGKAIGRFYLDMHPRPGKYNHNSTMTTVTGLRDRRLPEGVLVCNFPASTAADPGLMQYQDVVTFFHEFGHLMHHILAGRQQWAGTSGISAEQDFNEAPSQMLEEWMHNPVVLASFARHYKTGEPIPGDLVRRMNHALTFGRATLVANQNAAAALSYDIYNSDPKDLDPYVLGREERHHYTLFEPPPNSHGVASFIHLGNYSSMYYVYMWDKVIAEDLYAQFNAGNPFAGNAPSRYRHEVLEPGGSRSANDSVRQFLHRPVNMDAMKRWLNEEFLETSGG
ncbi:M3 family metallopeptidase [Tunturiibacter lichenicola]|uniref:M3 family metallopeptidase n=1 Tax=Tunturiibacter lichenicola TaxID=2051959 RepID=UPI0021B2C1AA|nr:M3 family metallopeptidase [Edaphobacter lichenicola]